MRRLLSAVNERYPFQGRCMYPREVVSNGESYPVPKGTSCATEDLFWPKQHTVTHRPRPTPLHTSHVVEIRTKCAIIVCQLIGNNAVERWRGTNGELISLPTAIQRKPLFFPTVLCLGCGKIVRTMWETVAGAPVAKRGEILLPIVGSSISTINRKLSSAWEEG